MSHYGITAIRWNPDQTEVAACRTHMVIQEDTGDFVLGDPADLEYHQIASRISRDDTVWVMVRGEAETYERSDKVRIKAGAGPFEYLESYTDDGQATHSLYDLPEF